MAKTKKVPSLANETISMADIEEVPGDYINERKDLHDCFFLVGNKDKERFSSVKLFLANHSPYFRAMLFESNMKENNSKEEIRIPDHEPDVFRLMLRYVYGCHDIHFKNFNQAIRFLMLADKCLMPKLKEISSEYMVNHCTSKVEILICAAQLGVKKLQPMAQKIVQEETKTLLYSKDFVELNSDIVLFIVKQEKLSVSELELWRGLLRWATYQCDNSNNGNILRAKMEGILQFIRFLVMSPNDFAREVVPASVLTTEESLAVLVAMVTGEDLTLASMSKTRKERCSQSILGSNTEFSLHSTMLNGYSYKIPYYSFNITVHRKQLKLKSITLFKGLFYVKLSLLQDAEVVTQVPEKYIDNDCVLSLSANDCWLRCNQIYTVRLQAMYSKSLTSLKVKKQESCDHCTVTFHNSNFSIGNLEFYSVVKKLQFSE